MGWWQRLLTQWFNTPPPFRGGDQVLLTLDNRALPIKLRTLVQEASRDTAVLVLPRGWHNLVNLDPGTPLCLTRMSPEGVLRVQAVIDRVDGEEESQLRVVLEGRRQRDQRRAMFRLEVQKPIQMRLLDDTGNLRLSVTADLSDLSAGGIGFTCPRFLAPGSRLEVSNLLETLVPGHEGRAFQLWVVWCQASRPQGFRIGACFQFTGEREQDQMVQVMNQLQMRRLGRLVRQPEGSA